MSTGLRIYLDFLMQCESAVCIQMEQETWLAKTLGYARISTSEGQDVASQKDRLEQLGAVVVFVDICNGSSLAGRDQLEAAIRLLEPGDTLLARHPDRLARDTADLLSIGKRVVEKKAVLRIHDPAIKFDGNDIMGEVLLTVFGLVGMIEKHFIKARQRRGIEAAKLKGDVSASTITMFPATIPPATMTIARSIHPKWMQCTMSSGTVGNPWCGVHGAGRVITGRA